MPADTDVVPTMIINCLIDTEVSEPDGRYILQLKCVDALKDQK